MRIVRVLFGTFAVAVAAIIITIGLSFAIGAQETLMLSRWQGLLVFAFAAAAFPFVWKYMK